MLCYLTVSVMASMKLSRESSPLPVLLALVKSLRPKSKASECAPEQHIPEEQI
jgi:hypothetical protein